MIENKDILNEKVKNFNFIISKENKTNHKNNKIFLCKKTYRHKICKSQNELINNKNYTSIFKVEEIYKYDKKRATNIITNEGRWSEEEHNKFLEGLVIYGVNWKNFKLLIKTRDSTQVRSHAQKFFHKMKLCKDENLGIDFTLNSIKNIKDMIEQIKSKDKNLNIIEVFKHLNNKINSINKSNKKNIYRSVCSSPFSKLLHRLIIRTSSVAGLLTK